MRPIDVLAIAAAVVIALVTLVIEPWSVPWWIGLITASVIVIATALHMARGIWSMGAIMVVLGVGLIVAGAIIGLIGAFKMDAPLLASETARSNLQKKPIELPKLLDLFKADFPALLKLEAEKVASLPGTPDYKFTSKAYFDFSAKTWFGAFFLPLGNQSYPVSAALAEDHTKVLGDLRNGAFAKVKVPGDSSPTDTEELVFSGRIFIYHEDDFTLRQQADLTDLYKSKWLSLQLRGRDYVISS